jgi:hypothetical protein
LASPSTSVSVLRRGDGAAAQYGLDVFSRGEHDALWHMWSEGSWSQWESLGGIVTADPAATSWGPGRIDAFARGTGGAFWHRWFEGGWNA